VATCGSCMCTCTVHSTRTVGLHTCTCTCTVVGQDNIYLRIKEVTTYVVFHLLYVYNVVLYQNNFKQKKRRYVYSTRTCTRTVRVPCVLRGTEILKYGSTFESMILSKVFYFRKYLRSFVQYLSSFVRKFFRTLYFRKYVLYVCSPS
jgi:hypothetical protein